MIPHRTAAAPVSRWFRLSLAVLLAAAGVCC